MNIVLHITKIYKSITEIVFVRLYVSTSMSNLVDATKIHRRHCPPPIRFQGKKTQVFFRRIRPSRWLRVRILILLLRDSGGGWWRCQLVENAWESQLDTPRLAGGCSHSRRAFFCAPSFYPSSHSFLFPVLSLLSSLLFLPPSLPFFFSLSLSPLRFYLSALYLFCFFVPPSSRSNLVS